MSVFGLYPTRYCPCWDEKVNCRNCVVVDSLRRAKNEPTLKSLEAVLELFKITDPYDYDLNGALMEGARFAYTAAMDTAVMMMSVYRRHRAVNKKMRLNGVQSNDPSLVRAATEAIANRCADGEQARALCQVWFDDYAALQLIQSEYPWIA
jgi:hypothetical protein